MKKDCRISLKIGSRYMLLPANYIIHEPLYSFPPVEGDDAQIAALWPGLEYRTEENRDEFDETLGVGRRVSGLIQSLDRFYSVREANPLGVTLDVMLGLFDREKISDQYGLSREIYLDNQVEYLDKPIKGANYGSVYDVFYKVDTENKSPLPQCKERDYKKKSKPAYCNQWISTVITCSPADQDPHLPPSCRHYFIVEALNAKVKISYSKKFLPEWAEIQKQMTELLSRFASTEQIF